jgi:hypothetical protein
MEIKRLDVNDLTFKEFVDNFKTEVGIDDRMYDWLDNKKLSRISNIICIIHNDQVVGVSCEKTYEGRYLRIGSPNYVLKPFRKVYPNSLFLKNGLFSKHIERAQKENLEIFFSIHAYNKRMKLHAQNFYKRSISSDLKNLDYLDDVKFLGIHLFHFVPQHIFSYNVMNTQGLLETISRTNETY